MLVLIATHAKRILTSTKAYVLKNNHPELGPYVQFLKVSYDISSLACNTPVYLSYDKEKRFYGITCLIIQFISIFSALTRIKLAGEALIKKRNVIMYFDFANETVLNVFIFWHFYLHWFETWRLEEYLESIQTTSLLRFNATPIWKAKTFPLMKWLVLLLNVKIWLRVVYKIELGTWESFIASGVSNAREIFWLPDTYPIGYFLSRTGILSRFENVFVQHSMLNAIVPLSAMPVYYIGKDFYTGILKRRMDPGVVLQLYEEYKGIIHAANKYASTYVLYYTFMVVTFFSVHLFDTLNTTDFWWQLNMYIYDVDMWVILYLPTRTLINVSLLVESI
ncbi:unnamed protein product [Allacma fusca]|uniref:Uncharacterized protein n=1 Tax=Allacma fusca TaxID=39272 RepID=A0A8J2KHV7_9HEXA|nr:unnamed protein product [Allacma fusca]